MRVVHGGGVFPVRPNPVLIMFNTQMSESKGERTEQNKMGDR